MILPIYFFAYVRNMSPYPTTLPNDALSRARTVLLAVALRYGVPSAALFLAPSGISLDAKQIMAAIWQPFPLYIAVFYNLLRKADASLKTTRRASAVDAKAALFWLKCSLYACALLSAIAHLCIFVPSLFATDPAYSFANVLVPYYLHPYLPIKPITAELPPYRLTVRLLFQHDWLTMTIAAYAFFAWSRHAGRTTLAGPWIARLIGLTVVGGPGAALAWAALEREERCLLALTRDKIL